MPFETELKFQVPPAARAALLRAVATARAQRTRLRATYADTADHRLAAAGFALRMRLEGSSWVQTLKGRGDGLAQRLEDEVPIGPSRHEPALDATRHNGTPAGKALAALLADGAALVPLYRTDIQRLHRRVRHAGALIELAYDRGFIETGGERVAVDEIEFELLSGPSQALPALAARWAAKHRLWWDVRTKSERGFRLAIGAAQVPAVRAAKALLPAGDGVFAVWQSTLASVLAQALPNAAEVAAGSGSPEHLHQLRVAIRRLRSALSLLAPWGMEDASHALEERWAVCFAELGQARDADVIAQTWLPRLQAAGCPPLAAPTSAGGAVPAEVVRGPAFTAAALDTLAWVLAPVPDGREESPRRAAASLVLRSAWRRAWADASVFEQADIPRRHRARKRIKRLRYAFEFLAPLYPAKAARPVQKALNRALEALGQCNDLQVARDHFRARAQTDGPSTQPGAWFADGWLAAQQPAALQHAVKALARLKAAAKPWRARARR